MKPAIVLVHGAFAESSSWDGVIETLSDAGHRVVAFANPLRSVAADAASLSDLVRTIEEPIVLVGHSYGGAVITNVDPGAGDTVGLVYVAGFALDAGEDCATAASLVPGGTLGETLVGVARSVGDTDLYIGPDRFAEQFAADVPERRAQLMAATQRPIAEAALREPSGAEPLWRSVPSWFIFGERDQSIPAGALRLMAERAGARRSVEIAGGSHAIGVSHPGETAQLIVEAAEAGSPAEVAS